MYRSNQLQIFKDTGDKRPNKCRFPFDGNGRLYGLQEAEKPEWEKVEQHFLALGKHVKVYYDKRIGRHFCTRYLYHRHDCNEKCPGYGSVKGVSNKRTTGGLKEGKEKKSSKKIKSIFNTRNIIRKD